MAKLPELLRKSKPKMADAFCPTAIRVLPSSCPLCARSGRELYSTTSQRNFRDKLLFRPPEVRVMSFDFSTLLWIFIALTLLQPLLAARWYVMRRIQAIRAIGKLHGSRVITMIHRQEKHSLFGFAVSRHIDLEDAQTIIAAIMDTPEDMPIDFVIHTPGGLVLAAMQIARALE
ncbi:MAG: hypothetical protein WAK55_06405, partial [Xanthobacteraceae bacterium]